MDTAAFGRPAVPDTKHKQTKMNEFNRRYVGRIWRHGRQMIVSQKGHSSTIRILSANPLLTDWIRYRVPMKWERRRQFKYIARTLFNVELIQKRYSQKHRDTSWIEIEDNQGNFSFSVLASLSSFKYIIQTFLNLLELSYIFMDASVRQHQVKFPTK